MTFLSARTWVSVWLNKNPSPLWIFYDCFPMGNYTRIHLLMKTKIQAAGCKGEGENMSHEAFIFRIQISKSVANSSTISRVFKMISGFCKALSIIFQLWSEELVNPENTQVMTAPNEHIKEVSLLLHSVVSFAYTHFFVRIRPFMSKRLETENNFQYGWWKNDSANTASICHFCFQVTETFQRQRVPSPCKETASLSRHMW